MLSALLQSSGQTRSLLTLFAGQSQRNPSDLEAKNNLASVALLLNAGEHRPDAIAREIYESQSTNAMFATTHAFALYQNKQFADARKVMDRLSAEDLEIPSIAPYYALILEASGDRLSARKYLGFGLASTWLPEETALFRKLQQE
jgi:hypothetical protein